MPGDPALARLFRDYGDEWEIEQVEPGTEWVACRRDGKLVEIISARGLRALRCQLDAAGRQDEAARS